MQGKENNFKRLKWTYEDILIHSVEELLKITDELGNQSELNHLDNKSSLYMIPTEKVVKPQFIKLMRLLGLTFRSNSVFLVVPPHTVGVTHTDTYYSETCNTSLHFDLSLVGHLEFFHSDIVGLPAISNETDYNVIDDRIANKLECIDFMPSQKSISIVRTNKPHRGVNNSDKFRVVLTCRFEDNPSFDLVASKLKKYIL
jgi:hypothetical protein